MLDQVVDTVCPKCGEPFLETSSCNEETETILKTGIMIWTCKCGQVYEEHLDVDELLELEEELRVEYRDIEGKE